MAIRLTDKEREIFRAAQMVPRLSVAELRARSGYRDHSIRYHIQRGLEEQVLVPRCFVNLHLLGYLQLEVFFSLAPDRAEGHVQLLEALRASDRVSWLGEVGGEFHYGANVCARSMAEAVSFFDALSAKFGHLVLDRQIAVRVSLDYFGNKYLAPDVESGKELSYEVTEERRTIDEVDHRILSALMKYSPLVRRPLAQHLGLPLSTLEHRIKRLEQAGIIGGYYYLIDPNKIGMQSFLFLVGVKGATPELKKRLGEFARLHPNVVVFLQTIGNWDFELAIDVEDARESIRISEQLHERFGSSLRFVKVLPSFGYPKVLEYPFREFVRVANS